MLVMVMLTNSLVVVLVIPQCLHGNGVFMVVLVSYQYLDGGAG